MKEQIRGTLLVLAAGSMWGCMGILVRRLNTLGLDSMEIAFTRVVIAFLFMLVGLLIIKPTALRIRWKDLWCFIGTGIVSLSIFTVCYFKTITITSLSVAAVLLYTAPAFVMLLSTWLFHEKLNRMKEIALVTAFLGCTMVTGIWSETVALSPKGILVGITSGIGYALYSIFSRYATERGYNSLTITTYTFLFGIIGLFPFVKVNHIVGCIQGNGIENLLIIIVLIFVVTVAPYLCYTAGLQKMENGKAAVIASIEPVVATLIGIFLYQETMTGMAFGGMLLVIASIVMLNVQWKKS